MNLKRKSENMTETLEFTLMATSSSTTGTSSSSPHQSHMLLLFHVGYSNRSNGSCFCVRVRVCTNMQLCCIFIDVCFILRWCCSYTILFCVETSVWWAIITNPIFKSHICLSFYLWTISSEYTADSSPLAPQYDLN